MHRRRTTQILRMKTDQLRHAIWSCRKRRERGHQVTPHSLILSLFRLLPSSSFLLFSLSFFSWLVALFPAILLVGTLAAGEFPVDWIAVFHLLLHFVLVFFRTFHIHLCFLFLLSLFSLDFFSLHVLVLMVVCSHIGWSLWNLFMLI